MGGFGAHGKNTTERRVETIHNTRLSYGLLDVAILFIWNKIMLTIAA